MGSPTWSQKSDPLRLLQDFPGPGGSVRGWRGRKSAVLGGGRQIPLRHWLATREKTILERSGPLVAVDFFCGGGGFTCGALSAKAVVACGVDCDDRVKDTYVKNNHNPGRKSVPFVHSRIEDLAPEALFQHLSPFLSRSLAFVGCPPCQPFTNLRTSKERSIHDREALASFIDHVRTFRPDFVVIENVPGIRAKKYDSIWEKSVNRLRSAGYSVEYAVVNAARYGVPQKRLRTILVACRSALGKPPWPEGTHQPESYRTVKDAFSETNLSRLTAGDTCERDSLHTAANLSDKNLRRIAAISRPGGTRLDWPEGLSLECYKEHEGHTDVYGRMDWNKPAPTLTTRFVSLSNGRFGHPEENRAITPREGALLQTFPPTYDFYDPLNSSRDMKVIQIGNAVPPRLAEAFVKAIQDRLLENGAG